MLHEIQHILEHTLEDTIKLVPFLLVTYILMEYIEHKMKEKTRHMIEHAGRVAPLFGGLIGIFPQCGFSAAAASLYAGKIITAGTLLAVLLSTSDEMIPVLLSSQAEAGLIIKILCIKVGIAVLFGFLLDYYRTQKKKKQEKNGKQTEEIHIDVHHMCQHEKCHCEKGILRSAVYHTITIFIFIYLVTLGLDIVIHFFGQDTLADLILNKPVIGHAVSALVGLIPNCASSVVITQLYIEGAMTAGAMISGLLAGSGVGILVLFRVNDDLRKNITILFLLYGIGVLSGILLDAAALL